MLLRRPLTATPSFKRAPPAGCDGAVDSPKAKGQGTLEARHSMPAGLWYRTHSPQSCGLLTGRAPATVRTVSTVRRGLSAATGKSRQAAYSSYTSKDSRVGDTMGSWKNVAHSCRQTESVALHVQRLLHTTRQGRGCCTASACSSFLKHPALLFTWQPCMQRASCYLQLRMPALLVLLQSLPGFKLIELKCRHL